VSRRPIRWTRPAGQDLEAAHDFLAEKNPAAARRMAADLLRAVDRLEEHPESGAVAFDLVPRGRYRHLVCGHHRIIYRLAPEALWILRVWDARRNPADLIPE
jgi:plasmid stabilization system protein ParE